MACIRCKKDVKMFKCGEVVFSKGKIYNTQREIYNDDPFHIHSVVYTTDDQGDKHIIKNINNDELDSFFYKHFEIVSGEL